MALRVGNMTDIVANEADEAFDRLFVREYRRVTSIAFRVLNEPDEAEDVAQNVFLSFHGRHDPDAHYAAAWLHRAAAHLALNAVRSRKRRVQRELGEGLEATTTAHAQNRDSDPPRALEAKEDRLRVRRVLSKLPKRSASILALRYSGLSYAEVAEALGCKPAHVGTMLRRAEAAFKKEIEHEAR